MHDRPDCPHCWETVQQRAEQDRQAHAALVDVAYSDLFATLDRAERAAAQLVQTGGRERVP